MTTQEQLAEACERFVYIARFDRFLCRFTGEYYPMIAIARKYQGICGEGASLSETVTFLLSPQGGLTLVDDVTFMPGAPLIVVSSEGVRSYNLWTEGWITRQSGDVTLFLSHLAHVLDDNEIAVKFVLQFMAHMLQKPEVKMAFAILIIGGQGIGKSLIAEFLAVLVGMENTAFVDMDMLTSPFNGFLLKSQLIVVNEFSSSANKATRAVIKNLITSSVLFCNQKGIAAIQIQNYANLILFSNEADAAKLDKDDRRFFVWLSSAQKRSPQYYTILCNWFENEGKHAVLDFLLNVDLSDFNPHAAPPKTESRAALIRESLSDQQQALHDMLESGEAPFDNELLVISDAVEFLNSRRGPRFTSREIASFLRSMGAHQLGQCRLKAHDGSERKPRVWALHNVDRWANAAEGVIAQAYVIPGGPHRLTVHQTPVPARLSTFRPVPRAARIGAQTSSEGNLSEL